MKNFNKKSIIAILATIVCALGIIGPARVFAGTSPTLVGASGYSVLGGAEVTCIGSTTTTGAVGVSPGSSLTGFPVPCTAGGGTQNNNASAIAAQADALTAFGTLDQTCDFSYGAQDLTLLSPLVPGVYCSTSSFSLSGNLTLTGSGVWIFKTVSTLITSPGSSVTGGDPCNVWWRIGSSTTLDTTTSFIGTVISQNGVNAMNTGATLDGRFLGLSAATVTLDANTITGPTCAASGDDDSGSGSGSSPSSGSSSSAAVPGLPNAGLGPNHRSSALWSVIIPTIGTVVVSGLFYLIHRKRASSPTSLWHE